MASNGLDLTGILASTDPYGRLRLCLVDELCQKVDLSWVRLRAAVPESSNYSVPYRLSSGGVPDDAGIRGECWITISGRGAQSRRQQSLLALAARLRGKTVAVTVTPKRYSFVSAGRLVAGTALRLETLEALDAQGPQI